MVTKLIDLTFLPKAISGWAAGPFSFADTLTLILAPNGSGKTPLVRGLAYCLGYPIDFPPPIEEHCLSVELRIQTDSTPVSIARKISQSFDVLALEGELPPKRFLNEKDFSTWMLEKLGIPARSFSTIKGGVSPGYMSVLVPMVYVDQDLGWRNVYTPRSTQNFLKDQIEEIPRWLLQIPARNTAIDKGEFDSAKNRLDSAKQQVEVRRFTLESIAKGLEKLPDAEVRTKLALRQEELAASLRQYSSILELLSTSSSTFDEDISKSSSERDSAHQALQSIQRRYTELNELGQNLEAELRILEMNEVAADAFRFLCGNDACQFFRRPEESYGRRLLYLKDQLKDFQTSSSAASLEVERLKQVLITTQSRVDQAVKSKVDSLKKTPVDGIVPAINAITTEIAEINQKISHLDRVAEERKDFEKAVNLVIRCDEEVNRLRPNRGAEKDNSRLWDVRVALGQSMVSWLTTLNTPNMPSDILIDEQLRVCFEGKPFTENSFYSGSTRTRIVLAYHASMLETSLKMNGVHPPLLILDTPKQQELHSADLQAFVQRFLKMIDDTQSTVQLIIAATETDFLDRTLAGETWKPSFGDQANPRFFGEAVSPKVASLTPASIPPTEPSSD